MRMDGASGRLSARQMFVPEAVAIAKEIHYGDYYARATISTE